MEERGRAGVRECHGGYGEARHEQVIRLVRPPNPFLLCDIHLTHAYSIFTPQVARAVPPRPVTTDDLERDRVLAQRIALFGWIEPTHLDVPVGEGTNGFLMFAQQGVYPLLTVISVAMALMADDRAHQGQPL